MVDVLKEDLKLYHITKIERLVQIFETKKLIIPQISEFEDPYESFIHKAYIEEDDYKSFSILSGHTFFAWCLTLMAESDAMWRIYSTEENKGDKDYCGVKLVMRVGKIRKVFDKVCDQFFLDKVTYDDALHNRSFLADKDFVISGPNSPDIVKLLFYKRTAFEHESEVRVIIKAENQENCRLLEVPIVPSDLIDSIILDPRLSDDVVEKFMKRLHSVPADIPIFQSKLYGIPKGTNRLRYDYHIRNSNSESPGNLE